MRTVFAYLAATAALVGVVFCGPASAITVTGGYNNINAVSAGAAPVDPLADSFTVGVSGLTLGDVKLDLESTTPSDGGSITIELLNDSSASPGTLLDTIGTLLDSQLTTSIATYTFPVSPPVALTSGRYWIEIVGSTSPESSAEWSYTSDLSGQGVSTEYNYISYAGTPVEANTSRDPFQMEVDPVPEPSRLVALLGVAGMGLVGLVWRRCRPAA
jgi:hypothetical protein